MYLQIDNSVKPKVREKNPAAPKGVNKRNKQNSFYTDKNV